MLDDRDSSPTTALALALGELWLASSEGGAGPSIQNESGIATMLREAGHSEIGPVSIKFPVSGLSHPGQAPGGDVR